MSGLRLSPADAHLPVVVFIHGGGNVRGAASENQYDGAYLAKKGVVFVNFNYRMNVFGFLAHPELTSGIGASFLWKLTRSSIRSPHFMGGRTISQLRRRSS